MRSADCTCGFSSLDGLIESRLSSGEAHHHAGVRRSHARVVRHDDIVEAEASQLADAQEAVEREQRRDGLRVAAPPRHRGGEDDGQLPRDGRVRARVLGLSRFQPRSRSRDSPSEWRSAGQRKMRPKSAWLGVVERPALRKQLVDVLREPRVHDGRRESEEVS